MCLSFYATRLPGSCASWYGKGYIYAHDDPHGALLLNYFPDGIDEVRLYVPRDTGFENV